MNMLLFNNNNTAQLENLLKKTIHIDSDNTAPLENLLKKTIHIDSDDFKTDFGSFFPEDNTVFEHINSHKQLKNEPNLIAQLAQDLGILEITSKNPSNSRFNPTDDQHTGKHSKSSHNKPGRQKKSSRFDQDFDKIYKKYPYLDKIYEKAHYYWEDAVNGTGGNELEVLVLIHNIPVIFANNLIDLHVVLLQMFLEQEKYHLVRELLNRVKSLEKDQDLAWVIKNQVWKLVNASQNYDKSKEVEVDLTVFESKFGLENIVFIDKFDVSRDQIVRIPAFDNILHSDYIAIYMERNPYQSNLVSVLQISTGNEVFVFDLIQICKFKNNIEKLVEFLGLLFHLKKNDIILFDAREQIRMLIKSLTYRNENTLKELVEKKAELCRIIDKNIKKACDLRHFTKSSSIKEIVENDLKFERFTEKYRYSDWDNRPLSQGQKQFAALEVQALMRLYDLMFLKNGQQVQGEGME